MGGFRIRALRAFGARVLARKSTCWLAFAAAFVGCISPLTANAQPFYAGKTIRLIINFEAGGAADIEARLFAQYLSPLVDGTPVIVAQNIAGAGGMLGTNAVGRGAKDGTMLGYLTGVGGKAAFEPQTFQGTELGNYEIIGFLPGASIYYARTDVRPGLRQPADLLKAENLYAGGLETGANKDLTIRLTLDMLGLKYGYITGYKGTAPARLAMQSGEINMFSDGRATYDSVITPMVRAGELIPLYYDTFWNGQTATVHKANADLPIKPFHEFYKEVKGVAPSGQLWQAYLALLAANTALQRVMALPPGSPNAAVDALRAGMAKLNSDAEFISAAQKSLGFKPDYVTGPDMNERVRQMTKVDPTMRAFIAEYTEKGRGEHPGQR
jgi:tripartite-type tricarboxylate transporter receptor subunit TctC